VLTGWGEAQPSGDRDRERGMLGIRQKCGTPVRSLMITNRRVWRTNGTRSVEGPSSLPVLARPSPEV
jgi:hypothetical protein